MRARERVKHGCIYVRVRRDVMQGAARVRHNQRETELTKTQRKYLKSEWKARSLDD